MSSTDSTNNPKEGKRLVYLILIFVIFPLLVLFPILTVYLSSSGLNENKKLKAEMKYYKDSIKIPSNEFLSLYKNIETKSDANNDKILVIQFYDKDCKDCNQVWAEMKRIQKEFSKKTKRVRLLTYVLKDESLDTLKIELAKLNIDTSTWDILVPKDQMMQEFIKQIKVDSSKASKTLVLTDRKGTIANYYNATSKEEINNLMRHTTMLLPAKEDRRKIKYKREKDLYQ